MSSTLIGISSTRPVHDPPAVYHTAIAGKEMFFHFLRTDYTTKFIHSIKQIFIIIIEKKDRKKGNQNDPLFSYIRMIQIKIKYNGTVDSLTLSLLSIHAHAQAHLSHLILCARI